MVSDTVWLFNISPHNWRECVDGPPENAVHDGHVGHPWHGLNSYTSHQADKMKEGDTVIVRQSKHGIMGVWEIEETAEVGSQSDHIWKEDVYERFVYCRALERELDPPIDDTRFIEGWEYAQFNAGANDLSDEYIEKFLTIVLDRDDLSQAAASRLRFELDKIGSTVPEPVEPEGRTHEHSRRYSTPDSTEKSADLEPPRQVDTTVSRVVRNTPLVKELKELYGHRCQVCDKRRERGSGEPYAEGHHIHPLGDDPPGIDHESNILILCPNHHADFDYGAIEVDPETKVISHSYDESVDGEELSVIDGHQIDDEHLEYHREEISTVS